MPADRGPRARTPAGARDPAIDLARGMAMVPPVRGHALIGASATGPVQLLALARLLADLTGLPQSALARIGSSTMVIFVTHVPIAAGARIAMRLRENRQLAADLADGDGAGRQLPLIVATLALDPALLHGSADCRTSPCPGPTYPAIPVIGVPRAVKPSRAATRSWNAAT